MSAVGSAALRSELPPAMRYVARLGISSRRLLICLLVALCFHAPLLPSTHLLSQLFHFGDTEETEDEGEAVIPLELELDDDDGSHEGPGPDNVTPIDTPGPREPTDVPIDAGTDAPVDAPEDAPVDAPADAPTDAPPLDAPPTPRRDPMEDLPSVKQITKNPNNVQIVLVGTKLRQHPVGAKMSALLPTIPQWEAFFAGSNVDPAADIDVMVITGPQMRVSGQIIAILQFNVPMEEVEDAVEKITELSKPEGMWLDGAPLKAARATADKGERVFALIPEKRLLCVFPWPGPTKKERDKLEPEELAKSEALARKKVDASLRSLKSLAKSFPDYSKKDYAVDISMVEPYKLTGTKDGVVKVDMGPLPSLSFEPIPRALTKMHLVVVTGSSDAQVTVTFDAPDSATAEDGRESLQAVWPLAQTGADVKWGMSLPDVKFERKGTTIEGQVTFSEEVLDKVYDLGEKAVEDAKKRRGKKK